MYDKLLIIQTKTLCIHKCCTKKNVAGNLSVSPYFWISEKQFLA